MTPQRNSSRDGIVIGLIGYAAVALFYSAFDLLAARGTLHTVNMLGRAVFRGLRDPSILMLPVELDKQAIFLYNALHLAIALAIGFVVARLVAIADEDPLLRRTVRFVIVAGYFLTVIVVGVLTMPLRDVVPWWSILIANAAAAIMAGTYIVARHPGLWRRLALEPS